MQDKIINKLRYIKRINRRIYKNELKYIDLKSENLINSETLKILLNCSIIDEEITNTIYDILEYKNFQNNQF